MRHRTAEEIYADDSGTVTAEAAERCDLAEAITRAWQSDDQAPDADSLVANYVAGSAHFRAGINAALTAVVGYGLPGLLTDAPGRVCDWCLEETARRSNTFGEPICAACAAKCCATCSRGISADDPGEHDGCDGGTLAEQWEAAS